MTSSLITYLFTQNLAGDLRFLPRLAHVLWRLRHDEARTLTVDLGGTCAAGVWHCDATQGRSMLIALDGLNFAAANVEGLPAEVRLSLLRSLTVMQLIDAQTPHTMAGVRFVTEATTPPDENTQVTLVLKPADDLHVSGSVVTLPPVPPRHIGRLRMRSGPDMLPEVVDLDFVEVPADTPPNATISGMVDFIESEARQYQRRKGKHGDPASS